MGPILVGEVNPHSPDCALCLCHPGSAGSRLRSILGLTEFQYLALRRENLCRGEWDQKDARRRAHELWDAAAGLVLLGRRVASACGMHKVPLFTGGHNTQVHVVLLPHPSGRSREWNDPGARDRAQNLLREYFPDVPWGES